MITKDSFKKLLTALEFTESKEVYSKHFENFELSVDFKNEELIYPNELIINEKQTCNFSSNENFVVFECVYRLLEKGYHPKHLELEPKWKLGHGASGGRADIWVKDNDGNSLLIIECKTAGKEFEDAWKDMLEDGGQLFSYFQQEKSTQFLALYASDFTDNEVKYDYKLIAVKDNEEYLKSFGKREVVNFKNADTVKNIFKAWSETYQKDYATKGLFEFDIPAYNIGKKKYTVADLKEVDNESIQKKYHEFATILRQHNVSGHENAFDKLVNLFLAKIVDETTNKEELAFYWKGAAYDDVKSLIDRLQKHYKIGMEKFLKEDVTYIEKAQIDEAFKFFKTKPDATKAKILDYFDQLKYYTNNDFAFIDVHNEKLFFQNSEVLLKIVQMLQDIKLHTDKQNQFLGDLFEGFLDKGVKQSEGQFFTPMPIVKFLISSLPLEKIITENPEIPKVIDYACGAGHFLNEYAHQILPFVKKPHIIDKTKVSIYELQKIKEYFAQIVGIEKEYRLSKVAKVSAFMYGQDNIEIIYADALAKNEKILDGTYSVLVANPPYSVKGFLETLDVESLERFELYKGIEDKQKKTNNSIECFFIERAKQLLKPHGVAAIVLPSSVLSNGNIYTRAREIILKYFDLIAITEFGSGTFGKTGTNTATLFLRRKDNNPDIAEHYQNRVNDWFNSDFSADGIFEDSILLKNYCLRISIDFEDYQTLLSANPSTKLLSTEIFIEYYKAFENSTENKNIQKKKLTEKYTQNHKEQEKNKAFIEYLQKIEKEKLYYYMLAESNPQPVCLVKSPLDNRSIKNFLGYEWSSAKGNEGIKYLNTSVSEYDDTISIMKGINSIKTPLFNPIDLNDVTKINTLIRNNFSNKNTNNTQPDFVSFAMLSDMLDFSRVSFDKALKTTPEKKITIQSKFPLVKLVDICGDTNIKKGKTITKTETKAGNYKVVAGGIDFAYYHNEYNSEVNTITISASGANAGYVNLWREKIFASDCTTIRGNSDLETMFLFYYLKSIQDKIYYLAKGQAQPHVYPDDLKTLPVPKIEIELQKTIVNECEKIEKEYNLSKMNIHEYKQKISQIFDTLYLSEKNGKLKWKKIKELSILINPHSINPAETPNKEFTYIDIDAVENGTGYFSTEKKILGNNAPSRARRFAKSGSTIISTVRPNLKGFAYVENEIADSVYSTGFAILQSSDEKVLLNKWIYYNFIYSEDLMKQMENAMPKGQYPSINKSDIENFEIPDISISEQKKIVAEIENYERKIVEAEIIINESEIEKRKILEKYLT